MSVKKPSKGLTSQATSTPRQPWKLESKKVEVTVVEELKKATNGKKREREVVFLLLFLSRRKSYKVSLKPG